MLLFMQLTTMATSKNIENDTKKTSQVA